MAARGSGSRPRCEPPSASFSAAWRPFPLPSSGLWWSGEAVARAGRSSRSGGRGHPRQCAHRRARPEPGPPGRARRRTPPRHRSAHHQQGLRFRPSRRSCWPARRFSPATRRWSSRAGWSPCRTLLTCSPGSAPDGRWGTGGSSTRWSEDGLTDAFERIHMGETAERAADRYGVSREAMRRCRRREPPPRRRRQRGRALRRRDAPGGSARPQGRGSRAPRRGDPLGRFRGVSLPATPGLPRGRQGHRRQLLRG